jgi:hypothetical protein
VCDRIAIIYGGRLVDILMPEDGNVKFGLAMAGRKRSRHERTGTESPSSVTLRSRVLRAVESFVLPRLTVTLFLVFLFALGTVKGVPVDNLISNSLSRSA